MPRRKKLKPSPETIADRVRWHLAARKMDQKDLAFQLNVSEGYVSRLLTHKRVWTVNLLLRMSVMLGVDVSELDPRIPETLRSDVLNLELSEAQLPLVYAMLKYGHKVRAPMDVAALCTVIQAFADRNRVESYTTQITNDERNVP